MPRLFIKLDWIVKVAFVLGHTSVDKIKLFCGGLWLLMFDKSKTSIDLYVSLRDGDHVFPFYIVDLGDFGTLHEVFCDEIYRTSVTHTVQTIIDIGSNVGASVVYFAHRFPDADIYGFEPDMNAYKCLTINTAHLDKVIVHNKAIWSASTERLFYTDPHRTNSSSLEQRRDRQIPVSVTTSSLDDILSSMEIDDVGIVKFDVEGAEYDIFSSFHQFDKIRFLIGEVHNDLIGGLNRFLDILPESFQITTTELGPNRTNLTAINTNVGANN